MPRHIPCTYQTRWSSSSRMYRLWRLEMMANRCLCGSVNESMKRARWSVIFWKLLLSGCAEGGCVEAVWPHHLTEPTAVESRCATCETDRQEQGFGPRGRTQDSLFLRELLDKRVPSLWREEMNASLCISSAQAQQQGCGPYTLVQSRPVSKS